MTMKFGKLKEFNSYFKKGLTVPQATSVLSDELEVGLGGQDGQLEAVVYAETDVVLADTKIITVTLKESSVSGGTFTDRLSQAITADGITTFAAGDEIARIPVPTNSLMYAKIGVATDDAAATGTMDIPVEGNFRM